MMTDEELDAFRKNIAINESSTVWLERKALDHIDEQSSKIATLKAALIADREELIVNGSSYVIWRYQNNIDPIDPNWGLIKSHVKEELAQEYPDIDWEE